MRIADATQCASVRLSLARSRGLPLKGIIKRLSPARAFLVPATCLFAAAGLSRLWISPTSSGHVARLGMHHATARFVARCAGGASLPLRLHDSDEHDRARPRCGGHGPDCAAERGRHRRRLRILGPAFRSQVGIPLRAFRFPSSWWNCIAAGLCWKANPMPGPPSRYSCPRIVSSRRRKRSPKNSAHDRP